MIKESSVKCLSMGVNSQKAVHGDLIQVEPDMSVSYWSGVPLVGIVSGIQSDGFYLKTDNNNVIKVLYNTVKSFLVLKRGSYFYHIFS